MSTYQNLFDDCAAILLERSGFTLGLISTAQWIEYAVAVFQDFLGKTGICQCVAVMPQQFGIPQYTLPDFISDAQACFSDGAAVRRDFEGNISTIDRQWQQKVGAPRSWRQDKQLPQQLSLYPAPTVESVNAPNYPPPGTYGAVLAWAPSSDLTSETAFIGTLIQTAGVAAFTTPGVFFGAQPLNQFSRGNVCAIGPVGLLTEAVTLASPIEALTDDWLTFIKFGILEKIWMSDSELKDVQRARYAHARYEEGCMIAAAVMGEVIDSQ
jgi:hypothetical protein